MRIFVIAAIFVVIAASPPLAKQFFSYLDRDSDGFISPLEVAKFAVDVDGGDLLNDDAAKKLMQFIDAETTIDLKQFCEMANDDCLEVDENGMRSPEQVHLAPGASNDKMVVSWVVLGKNSDKASEAAVVEFGTAAKNMSAQSIATSQTYDCGIPKWEGTSFSATLTGLAPGTTYWYRVGNAASNEFSETFEFTSVASTAALPTRIAIFGDMGTVIPAGWLVAKQLARLHESQPFDSMVIVGDIAYAGVSSEKLKELPFVWDMYGRQMAPVASKIPYITNVGNHEKYCNYSSFQARYHMPGPKTPASGNGNFWFSVTRGIVQFVAMSTEHPYEEGSEQRLFLEEELEKAVANRENVPWIVLLGHRPIYNSNSNEQSQHQPGAYFQQTIEPMINKYKVDIYVGGHMHCYERVHPIIANGTIDTAAIHGNVYVSPNGAVHVTQGTAGSTERDPWSKPQPDWSAHRIELYGTGVITAHNASLLQYDFLHVRGDDVVDSFFISK